MKPVILALILACLLTACGDGGCDWLQVPQKPSHVPGGNK